MMRFASKQAGPSMVLFTVTGRAVLKRPNAGLLNSVAREEVRKVHGARFVPDFLHDVRRQ